MNDQNTDKTEALDAKTRAALRELSDAGVSPDRDLWPALRSQILAHRRRRFRWVGVAAAISLVVVSVSLINHRGAKFSLEPALELGAPPEAASASLIEERNRYLTQREVLRAIVAKDLEHYPAEVRADVQQSLDTLGRAIARLEQALDPSETDEARLVRLYELELEMLASVQSRLRVSAGFLLEDERG